MGVQLIEEGWSRQLSDALEADHTTVQVACPFIKQRTAARLLECGTPEHFQILTRFDLAGFAQRVSDLSALKDLLRAGAQIRGLQRLHSKLYLIGPEAIVTSANLTHGGLHENYELGVSGREADFVDNCRAYFSRLWSLAGDDLRPSQIDEWQKTVEEVWRRGAAPPAGSDLPDHGAASQSTEEHVHLPRWASDATQGFVKFFGERHRPERRSHAVLAEVTRSACHWACSYPFNKRPRAVRDGALMFMGRLVEDPDDILIFGRAVGMAHREGRDDATEADQARRPFMEHWSRYVRVYDAEFVAGPLGNGVSLRRMEDELGPNAYRATQEHLRAGSGNTNPRRSYQRAAAVELSHDGMNWMNLELQRAMAIHDRVPQKELDELDWPELAPRR